MLNQDDFPHVQLTPIERTAQIIVMTFVIAFGLLLLAGLTLGVMALASVVIG